MARQSNPTVDHLAARVGRLSQSYGRDHPKFIEAKRDLDYAKVTGQLVRVVDTWGAPSEEQRAEITQILGPTIDYVPAAEAIES